MSARATIRAGPNGLVLEAAIAFPFVEFVSSTLEARQPGVIVAKSRRDSYQPPIPCPTQGGGGEGEPGVPSTREPDPIPLAHVRRRRADRAPADRRDARSAGRTRLAGRAAHDAVVRASGDRDPGAPDHCASVVSLRASGALAAGGGDLVRRLAPHPVRDQHLRGRAGSRVPAREPTRPPTGRHRPGPRDRRGRGPPLPDTPRHHRPAPPPSAPGPRSLGGGASPSAS